MDNISKLEKNMCVAHNLMYSAESQTAFKTLKLNYRPI